MDNNKLQIRQEIFDRYICSYASKCHTKQEPLTYTILTTRRCPLKCRHCFNNQQLDNSLKNNELSLEEYKRIAEQLPPFMSVYFGGGEPFIREDFSEIVNVFFEKCHMQWASVTTNGILQDSILSQMKKICERLRGKKFVLNFSLDGDELEHDFIRGKGVYSKCLDTIQKCIELKQEYNNFSIGIVTTMTTINENKVCEFWDGLLEKITPDVISLLLVRQFPRDGEYLKSIDPQNYKKATEKLYDLFLRKRNGSPDTINAYFPFAFYDIINKTINTHKKEFLCYAGKYGAFIDYNGDINPCEVIGDPLCNPSGIVIGNLRDYEYNFMKLWNSMTGINVRGMVNKCKACEKCTHETEGISPSLYFSPNDKYYKERIFDYVKNT